MSETTLLIKLISIHAPARGATVIDDDVKEEVTISIHAPARGATIQETLQKSSHRKFQSTLPRGERRRVIDSAFCCFNFNPRSREGSDHMGICWTLSRQKFQSTLPRGERLAGDTKDVTTYDDFNPRSREGSDCSRMDCRRYRGYFNPRSREGSDFDLKNLIIHFLNFNPRSREGSDGNIEVKCMRERLNFNPRSREGSDKE